METFDPPKHPSFIGSLCLRGSIPFSNSHQVDVQWEYRTVYKIEPRGESVAAGQPYHYFTVKFLPLLTCPQLFEVTSGVAYLHELRIVHGDLKGVGF